MSVFRPDLTLSPSEVASQRTHVLEESGRIVGFYTLAPRSDAEAELDHLFVDPSRLRRGLGATLFRHACATARAAGFRRLVIRSDPNAPGFYESVGARLESHVPSNIPGRSLPFFSLDLHP